MVGGAGSAILLTTMNLPQAADTDGFAEIDVAGDGRGTDVEPVGGLGGELLEVTSLHGINPAGNGQLSLTLQESSVGFNELLGIDIANRNARHNERSVFSDVSFLFKARDSQTNCWTARNNPLGHGKITWIVLL